MQDDQQHQDHQVPDRRRDRRDRELVVGLQDPHEQPGQAQQQHDREQHSREARGQPGRDVGAREQRDDQPRDREPQQRQRAEPDQDDPEQRRRDPERLPLSPLCSSSVNTGTNAADSAACENRLLNRFGTWEASVNAELPGEVAKYAAWTTSRPSPAIRESAVAIAKIAVLSAIRRRGGTRRRVQFEGLGVHGAPL